VNDEALMITKAMVRMTKGMAASFPNYQWERMKTGDKPEQ